MAPTIGITTSYESGEQKILHNYVQAVEEAGAVPILLPIVSTDDTLRILIELLDGLVVIGGPAITDGLIGEIPPDLSLTDPVRSSFDKRVVKAFLERPGAPLLGICYGMQLINALAGGTIYADVQHQLPGSHVHSAKRGGTTHPIALVPHTHLATLLEAVTAGGDAVVVNTVHCQAVATLGNAPLSASHSSPLRVCATAPDGVVEAIESLDGLVLGVQFHPERLRDAIRRPIFAHLARLASVFQASRAAIHSP